MAPEQQTASPSYLGPPVDCWALGALIFEMLEGRPAFNGGSLQQVSQRIRTAAHEQFRTNASAESRALVKSLITSSPTKRASMETIMAQPWIN